MLREAASATILVTVLLAAALLVEAIAGGLPALAAPNGQIGAPPTDTPVIIIVPPTSTPTPRIIVEPTSTDTPVTRLDTPTLTPKPVPTTSVPPTATPVAVAPTSTSTQAPAPDTPTLTPVAITTSVPPTSTPVAVAPTSTPALGQPPTATMTPVNAELATLAPPGIATLPPSGPDGLTLPTSTPTPLGISVPEPTDTPFGLTGPIPTPTLPSLQGPGGDVPDLEVWAMEVTQGIQDLENKMPLVAERRTAVRVYIKTDGGDWPNVKGVLGGWRGGQYLGVIPSENQPITVHEDGGDRLDVNDSLYFFLPPEWPLGTLKLKVFVYSGNVNAPEEQEPSAENNFFEVNNLEFHEANEAHVMLVPVHLHDDDDANTPEHLYLYPENFGVTISLTLDIYRLSPAPHVTIYGGTFWDQVYPMLHEVPLDQEGPTGPREWKLDDPLQVSMPLTRIALFKANTDPWVDGLGWYGMVRSDIAMKMQKQGFNPISISGIAGGGVAYGKMDNAHSNSSPWNISKGATLAHELAHNLGLQHVNCKGTEAAGGGVDDNYPYQEPDCSIANVDPEGYMGFDVYSSYWLYLDGPTVISNDPGVSAPNQGFPMMGYQSPKWIDPYDYCKMLVGYGVPCEIDDLQIQALPRAADDPYIRSRAPDRERGVVYVSLTGGAARETTPATQLSGEYLSVIGILNRDLPTADFVEVMRTSDPRPHALAEAEERQALIAAQGLTSPFSLNLEDAEGVVLLSQPLVDLNAPPHEGQISEQVFVELVPFPADTAFVRVRHGDDILAERAVSASAPRVTLLAPNGGETLTAPLDISWTASDADGDLLSYMVQYSADAGTTWRVLDSGLFESTLRLESLDNLPGSDQVLFRVVAGDGVNTGQDDSDAVSTVPNGAPFAAIYAPADGAVVAQGALVILEGTATDWEDGAISGSALNWESDVDGALGAGPELHVRDLSVGTHLITLRATDSDGVTGERTVSLTITSEGAQERPSAEELEQAAAILQTGLSDDDGSPLLFIIGGAVAAAVVLLGGVGWYTRRRLLR